LAEMNDLIRNVPPLNGELVNQIHYQSTLSW
jgi:hypothetical protein